MMKRHLRTAICIILSICMIVPCAITMSGCGMSKVNTDEVRKEILGYVDSEESKTGALLGAAQSQNQRELDALNQYKQSINLSDIVYTRDKATATENLNCSISIPTVKSLQKELLSSDSFLGEYEAADDTMKKQCIYDYVINILIAGTNVENENMTLSSSNADIDSAIADLKLKVDEVYQQSLSDFILTQFYSEEAIKTINEEAIPFVEAEDLSDFVVKYNKHKVAVTNIIVLQGDAAKEKLCSLSENNKLIELGSSQQLYYVKYQMTNLTKGKDGVKLDNFFSLGDSSAHLYSNTGFHFEGLSIPTTLKYGESGVFSAALVGDAAANLYFYNANLYGARHWGGVPVSTTN